METVVRGSAAKKVSAVPARSGDSSKADLRALVGGILQRMGPMELERSDEAVLFGSGDALRLLAHPNVAPVIPVAPQPLPFGLSNGQEVKPTVVEPGPEASILLGKVADKLERLRVLSADAPPTVPVDGAGRALTREEIEARALLAVARKRGEGDTAPPEGGPTNSRLTPLNLLADVEVPQLEASAVVPGRTPARRELRGLMEVDFEPIAPLPPAKRLAPALERTRPLVLLQPESY